MLLGARWMARGKGIRPGAPGVGDCWGEPRQTGRMPRRPRPAASALAVGSNALPLIPAFI